MKDVVGIQLLLSSFSVTRIFNLENVSVLGTFLFFNIYLLKPSRDSYILDFVRRLKVGKYEICLILN